MLSKNPGLDFVALFLEDSRITHMMLLQPVFLQDAVGSSLVAIGEFGW